MTSSVQAEIDAFDHQGREAYVRLIAPNLGPADDGMFVGIDVETERFAIGPDPVDVWNSLDGTNRGRYIWRSRVGRIGFRRTGFVKANGI